MNHTVYIRRLLCKVLIAHQCMDPTACSCGWAKLGASFADHIADEYEAAFAELVK